MRNLWVTLAFGCLLTAVGAATFTDDFSHGADRWQPLHAENWAIKQDGDNPYLALIKVPPLRPGVRRPAEYTLVKDLRWRDETITCRLMSLRPHGYTGRDCVVIFGWRDDTHFYYAHICNDSNGTVHNVIMKVDGDKLRLSFAHAGGGLRSRDGKPLAEFEIAGADGKFVPAEATIDGDTVLVASKEVASPTQVRFGWRNVANPNLINKEGLPASPFQTNNWQGGTGE